MNQYDTGYCRSLTNISRDFTKVVSIGNTPIGYPYPIRVQSMTTTNTNDIETTVEQCIRIIDAGGEYVRITAQGIKEAEALRDIKFELLKRGYTTPLVADIHFNPKAALVAAQYIEKVRINPGNYTESSLKTTYTTEEYKEELNNIRSKLKPLIEICKEHGTCIRIGVNHGSLSSRIMSRYGDSPIGMAMSMMEFLQICRDESFFNVVCSIKASNTRIMVYATRLLVKFMQEENMKFPIHLGVTEAGDSKEGRIKSAVGIGSLLSDGIGDTIRVSLTEEPEYEIPVAKILADYALLKQTKSEALPEIEEFRKNPFDYQRRTCIETYNIGGNKPPVVIATYNKSDFTSHLKADFYIADAPVKGLNTIVPASVWQNEPNCFPLFTITEFLSAKNKSEKYNFVTVSLDQKSMISELVKNTHEKIILIFESNLLNFTGSARIFFSYLQQIQCNYPVILSKTYSEKDCSTFQIQSGFDFGSILIDGFGDGLYIKNPEISNSDVIDTEFIILQSSRSRYSKTEYISCPSCGRTLFNIQETVREIKEKTAHLAGVKIGIMGCIVNGPGEMADADYGFVGAGQGKINLFKQKNLIKKNIPEELALDALIELIKENGDWKEKK